MAKLHYPNLSIKRILFWLFLALLAWRAIPTGHIIASWSEPMSHKPDGTSYTLELRELDTKLFALDGRRNLVLFIGAHGSNESSYGHYMPIELFGEAKESMCKSACSVVWSPNGVEFSQDYGHRVFIPAKAYQGGR